MQDCYADVIVDITSEKLDRVFQYRVPDKMQDALEPGMVVEIPFGAGNRKIRGYVTAISGHTDYDPEKIKEIASIVTDGVGAESRLIGLAAWIRNRYGSTMIQALKVVLPVKRKVRGKDKKTVYLILDKPEAQEKLKFFQKKHQTARARLLEALIEEQAIPYELVTEKLNVASGVVKALEQQGIVTLKSEKIYRNPVSVSVTENYAVCLNEEQRRITDEIIREWEEKPNGRYLIHGVTGSGKTEVYMELIAHAVSRGQQAIVLIPEIALTYQTVIRFYRRFGDRVSVINSRLSAGERYDQFERARQGELDVMIGPRSALFTPFPNLGESGAWLCHTLSGGILRSAKWAVPAVYVKAAGWNGGSASGICGRPETRTSGGKPFHIKQRTSQEDGRMSGWRGSNDAVFKPQRLCGLCLLPCLWTCAQMPSLRCIPGASQRGKIDLPLLRLRRTNREKMPCLWLRIYPQLQGGDAADRGRSKKGISGRPYPAHGHGHYEGESGACCNPLCLCEPRGRYSDRHTDDR